MHTSPTLCRLRTTSLRQPISPRRGALALLLCLFSTLTLADSSTEPGLGANSAEIRLSSWHNLIDNSASLSADEKLDAANRMINRLVSYASDQQTWGQEDYWATPAETISQGQGDCEDFAIAKYFTLVKMGIPVERLRLTYVKVLGRQEPHMVLAYYQDPQTQPLILDSLNPEVAKAATRKDLLPVYSFNAEGIYLAKAPNQKIAHPPSMLSRWEELSARIQSSDKPNPVL